MLVFAAIPSGSYEAILCLEQRAARRDSRLWAISEADHARVQNRFDKSSKTVASAVVVNRKSGGPKEYKDMLYGKPIRKLTIPESITSFAVAGGTGGLILGQVAGGITGLVYAIELALAWENFIAAIFLGVMLGFVAALVVGGALGAVFGLGVGVTNKLRKNND